MKRLTSHADHKNPSQPRRHAHSRRNFHPIRSSDASTSRGFEDTKCRKRVKFTDLSDDPLSCRPHAKSTSSQVTCTIRSGEPKTSEYAFFKQLKEDAGHRSDSRSVYKEQNQPDKLSSNYSPIEKAGVKNSFADLRASLRAEYNSDSFFSPVVSAAKNSEANLKAATAMENRGCVQENMGGFNNTLKSTSTENRHADIFSRKREKLRQWVMDTSFPETELCSTSNGYDFVSALLGRLIPKSSEDNSFKPPKSGQVDADVKRKSLASPEPDIHSKKPYQITGNSMEVDCGQYFEDGLSSYWSDRSRETSLSDYDSSIFHAHKTHHQDIMIKEPEYRLGRRTAISCTKTNSDFDISFEKYGPFPLSHIKEQHEFRTQNGYLLGREPQALLLGWDSGITKEGYFSNNCQNLELITYPTSSTLWDDDHQQNTDAASWLSTSSNPTNFNSFLPTQLPDSHNHDFGRHILEENENMVAGLNHFPLTLLNGPDYLNLKENCNYNDTCKGSSVALYSRDHNWFERVVLPDRCYPGNEAFLSSSGYDIDSGWKSLSITRAASSGDIFSCSSDDLQFPQKKGTSLFLTDGKCELDDSVLRDAANHYSNTFDIHELPTFYFQASLNGRITCPLLLDKSSWDGLEREKSIDDDGELENI